MILFHATTETKGKKILKEGVIKINSPSSFDDIPKMFYETPEQYVNLETEKGFVYFSNRISVAHDIIKSTVNEDDDFIYIFKLNIPDVYLLPDLQQAKIMNSNATNTMEILKECFSTRVNFDVNIKKYQGELTKIPSIWNYYSFSKKYPDSDKKIFDDIRNWVSDSHNYFTKDIEKKEKEFEKNFKWEKI
ncbi:MAG: hypothetical protein SOY60_03565 [Fusobacterium gastrosuis]|uniref:hypothetical protein n=1 Tax=Fusobacterium gastrosuis TaxID=1755100 RepID=UPI002A8608D6|nr:hypothetical protein [Fusobacterium gastrosuis]